MSIGWIVQKFKSAEAVTEGDRNFFLKYLYSFCSKVFVRVSRDFRVPYRLVYYNIQITGAYETFKVFLWVNDQLDTQLRYTKRLLL